MSNERNTFCYCISIIVQVNIVLDSDWRMVNEAVNLVWSLEHEQLTVSMYPINLMLDIITE